MAFLFLTNTVGANATTLEDSAAINAGSDLTHIIAGTRDQIVKGNAGTSHTVKYNCSSTEVSHAVITNADLFKNGVNATQVLLQYGATPTTDSTTTIASMSLVGPKSQDWVKTIARTSTAFLVKFEHSVSSESWYGKIFFSNKFDFETPPQFITSEARLEEVRPLLGHMRYMTEQLMVMQFLNLTQAKMASFRALPLHQPFFIYDEDGDHWNHKLEHVVIADPWTELRRLDGNYSLELTVRRLRHYI